MVITPRPPNRHLIWIATRRRFLPMAGEGMSDRARRLIENSKVVVFEFEGTVARYTSGGRDVSKILSVLANKTALKLNLLASQDIPELLRALDFTFTELAEAGEREIQKREVEVAGRSPAKPGLRFLLKSLRNSGIKTACVGTTSHAGIKSFLASVGLSEEFDVVVGRPSALAHMLPQPHMLITVLQRTSIFDTDQVFLIASSGSAAKAADKIQIKYSFLKCEENKLSPDLAERSDLFVDSLVELGSYFGKAELDQEEQKSFRIDELHRKGQAQGLTWAELVEMMRLGGAQGYQSMGNVSAFGYVNSEHARENLSILEMSRREAAKNNLVLEVFAATAIMVEMELRTWFISCKGRRFATTDRHTLGQLVSDAKRQEFDADLIARLQAFVSLRNLGIHRVISGEGRYFSIGSDFMKDPAIVEDVRDWVRGQLPTTPI
ncbi:HAD family hydrolase [Actinoplanes sp. NPDC000266]